MLCTKFGWNWPSGSGEEVENVKSLQTDRQTDRRTDRRTDGQTDAGRQVIRKAHLTFQLRWAKNNNEVTAVPPNFKKLTGLYYLFIHDTIYCRGQDEVLSWVDIWYYFTNHQNCWQKIEEEQKTQNRTYQMRLFIKYTMKWSGWWEHKFPPEYKLPGKIVRLFFLNNPRRTWVSGCRWGQISLRPPG